MTRKKKNKKPNIRKIFILTALVLFFVFIGSAAGFVVGVARNLPQWSPEDFEPALTTFIYDKEGELIEKLHGVQNRIPVELEEIPKHLTDAFIATEDVRFWNHHGLDLKALARAVFENIRSGWGAEGGSTITQQLAKNVFIENREKTLKRKIQEAVLAIQLERKLTKKQILEEYLNWIYFGEGAWGVQAASRTYFNKDVSELNLAQSALLAGLVKAPALYSPFKNLEAAKGRQEQVLTNMQKYGYITEEEKKQALEAPLELSRGKEDTQKYRFPYVVDYVAEQAEDLLKANGINPRELYTGGLKIYTTVDSDVQQKIEEVYANTANFPPGAKDRPVESAMVILDHETGGIVGIAGGRYYSQRRGFNRAVQAKRQPGSSIKPIAVYAPALENGYTPATVLDDVPTTIPHNPPYTPTNYDGRYRGLITMREAVRWSVNVAAVRMLDKIGVEKGYTFAQKMGLTLEPEDKNPSLALGGLTNGVSPLQMASAYGTFANQGVRIEPHIITEITTFNGKVVAKTNPQRDIVMEEQTAYLMTDMLKTVVKSGTGTRAKISNWSVAGKTGTTQLPSSMGNIRGTKDAWFIGYTPYFTASVWMGYDKTDASHYLRNVAGGSYPALIWKKIMQEALKRLPRKDFTRPSGIVYASVDAKSGLLPSNLTPENFIITEIFTKNTLPRKTSDVWVKEEVCAESNKLPGPYCPNVVSKTFLKRPVPYNPSRYPRMPLPEDFHLEVPKTQCSIHGQEAMVEVDICTDPRHEGRLILATEGCPQEYVVTQEFPENEVPTQYCNLPDHKKDDSQEVDNPEEENNSAPPAPELSASVVPGKGIMLSWSAKKNEDIVFSIEKSVNGTARYNLNFTKDKSYLDKEVEPNKVYYYRVFAHDRKHNLSTPSNEVRIEYRPDG